MVYNVFLDTNIIIDYFLAERKCHSEAKKIIAAIEQETLHGCISESVINTSAYILSKALPLKELKEYLSEMADFLKILPCSNSTIRSAYQNAENDLEDAVLYQIALENKLDYFITSDEKDFKRIEKALLPVLKPEELVKLIAIN